MIGGRNIPRRYVPILGIGALAWSVIVASVVANKYSLLNGRPLSIAISLVPGLALWAYVIWRPRRVNVAIRVASAVVGIGATVINARYMASRSCTTDALCGVNVLNAPAVEVLAFGIPWILITLVANRTRGSDARHGT